MGPGVGTSLGGLEVGNRLGAGVGAGVGMKVGAWEGAQAVPSTSAQHRTKNSSAPALLPCSPIATRPARLLNRLPIKYLFVEVECETEEGRQKHDNGK